MCCNAKWKKHLQLGCTFDDSYIKRISVYRNSSSESAEVKRVGLCTVFPYYGRQASEGKGGGSESLVEKNKPLKSWHLVYSSLPWALGDITNYCFSGSSQAQTQP